jgi:phage terminase Nu1 subunit (DNA packaging protein)
VTERYVDSRGLAEALGVSVTTVKRWTRAGAPSETWGMRVRRFRVSEVETWLRRADTLSGNPSRPAALQRRRA